MNYNFLIIIVLQFTLFAVYSQDQLGDSQASVQSINSALEAEQLLIETENLRTKNFQQFNINLEILKSSQSILTPQQQCLFNYLSIYKISLKGEFDKAIVDLKKLFQECEQLTIQIRVKSLLSNLYVISGNYLEAMSNLDFVITHIKEIPDKASLYYAYVTAMIIYDTVDQFDLSLKFSALLIAEKPNKIYMCKAKVYKYISLLKIQKNEDLDDEIVSVIHNCENIGEIIYAQGLNIEWIKSKLLKANTLEKLQKLNSVLSESNDEIEKTKYKNIISEKNSLVARIAEKLNDPQKAIKFAKLAIKDSLSIGYTQQKVDSLQILVNYFQNMEDYKEANKYLIEKYQTEKKLYSDKQEKLMAYQSVKHDSLAKTLQIKSLSQKNQVLKLENNLADESKTNQRLLTIIFAIIVVYLLIQGYKVKKKQQEYKRLSELDHMTLVYNRKGLKDYMNYLLPYSEKKKEVIAYGTFDLDLFKKINDKYGHLIGDWVIKTVVKTCQNINNEKVTFARLGGEEFAIIIRDSNLDEIKHFSEQCRKAIYAISTLEETGSNFKISASFGLTTTNISGYSYLDLMENADTALYVSKDKGRNQISVYQNR